MWKELETQPFTNPSTAPGFIRKKCFCIIDVRFPEDIYSSFVISFQNKSAGLQKMYSWLLQKLAKQTITNFIPGLYSVGRKWQNKQVSIKCLRYTYCFYFNYQKNKAVHTTPAKCSRTSFSSFVLTVCTLVTMETNALY